MPALAFLALIGNIDWPVRDCDGTFFWMVEQFGVTVLCCTLFEDCTRPASEQVASPCRQRSGYLCDKTFLRLTVNLMWLCSPLAAVITCRSLRIQYNNNSSSRARDEEGPAFPRSSRSMLDQLMVPQAAPAQLKRKRKAENQQRGTSSCKKTMPPRREQLGSYYGHECLVSHHHNGATTTPNHHHPLISNYSPQEICLQHNNGGEEPTDSESDFSCLDGINSYGRTSPSLAGSWSNHNHHSNQKAAAAAGVAGFVTPDFSVAPFAHHTQRDTEDFVSKSTANTMVGEGASNGAGATTALRCHRDAEADEWGWFVDAGEDELRASSSVPTSRGNVQQQQWGVHRVAQD